MNINELMPKHVNMEELYSQVPDFNGTFEEFVEMLMSHEVTLATNDDGEIVDFWVQASDNQMLDTLIGQRFAWSYVSLYSSETLMNWLGMVIKAKQAGLKIEDIDEDLGTCKIGGVKTQFKEASHGAHSAELYDEDDEDWELDSYDEAVEYLEDNGIDMDPCCSEEGEYACELLDELDRYDEESLTGLIRDVLKWRDEQAEEDKDSDDTITKIFTLRELQDFVNGDIVTIPDIKRYIRWTTKHCIARGCNLKFQSTDGSYVKVSGIKLGRPLSEKEYEDLTTHTDSVM